jgi:hypothetical protein
MSTTLKIVIILISIASIVFSLLAIYNGQKAFDALGGVIIGCALLASLFFDKFTTKKEDN